MTDNKYQKGKIYKIVNDIDNEIYVGSTIQQLCNRMALHRKDSTSPKTENRLLYKHINKYGIEFFRIVLIEEYPCKNKQQLEAREEFWRKELHATLNMIACTMGCSKEEYMKQYNQTLRVTGKKKESDKKYREKNKDRLREMRKVYDKQYVVKNHAKVNMSLICDTCASIYSKRNFTRHSMTQFHNQFITMQKQIQDTTNDYNQLIQQ